MPASLERANGAGPPRGRVLFLCTGNSACSQMAEALVNHHLKAQWEAHSAGSAPAGYVHPLALKVLAEVGVSPSRLHSKSVEACDVLDLLRPLGISHGLDPGFVHH